MHIALLQLQQRIGNELHDTIGAELAGLQLLAEDLATSLSDVHSPASAPAARLAAGVRLALEHVTQLARGIALSEVAAGRLKFALADLAKRSTGLNGVDCSFRAIGCPEAAVASDHEATQLFRIATEAVTNALKHAGAESIRLALELRRGVLKLEVHDDGKGFGGAPLESGGLGLRTMHDRANQIGARLVIRPRQGGGTRVICTIDKGEDHG